MSLTKEQADYIRSLGDKARELFPEAFESERIDLLAANNGNKVFMQDILLEAGLKGDDILIATHSTHGIAIFISNNLIPELKEMPYYNYHLLILKRAKNDNNTVHISEK